MDMISLIQGFSSALDGRCFYCCFVSLIAKINRIRFIIIFSSAVVTGSAAMNTGRIHEFAGIAAGVAGRRSADIIRITNRRDSANTGWQFWLHASQQAVLRS